MEDGFIRQFPNMDTFEAYNFTTDLVLKFHSNSVESKIPEGSLIEAVSYQRSRLLRLKELEMNLRVEKYNFQEGYLLLLQTIPSIRNFKGNSIGRVENIILYLVFNCVIILLLVIIRRRKFQ